jgi:hypothetical protein
MATIHWFSLNEPFDKSRFDSNQLKDIVKLRKLVNPKETGATKIDSLNWIRKTVRLTAQRRSLQQQLDLAGPGIANLIVSSLV